MFLMKQNSNFANFLLFFRDKFMEKMADFLGILEIWGQFCRNTKKKPISQKFSGERKKEIGFGLFSRTFLMKQNSNFANIFFGGWGAGMMNINLCNNNNNRNINFL